MRYNLVVMMNQHAVDLSERGEALIVFLSLVDMSARSACCYVDAS